MKKKGLSPVIATVLLISMAVVLAGIIFVWAKSFVGEKVQKFDEPIENSCANIDFDAEAYLGAQGMELHLINRGTVPLYGVKIYSESAGSVEEQKTLDSTISSGETATLPLDSSITGNLIIVPVILGKGSSGKTGTYSCGEDYGVSITAV